jgi:glycosyltransferase involved in cell wall biosynthesis
MIRQEFFMKFDFSIVIPTYGRPLLLEHAINSALNQRTDIRFEIIVVDNDHDSKYESESTVRNFSDERIRYVRNPVNLGMCGNWNKCIELASSEWLTILHDDDQLHPEYVQRIFKHIKLNPQLSIIGCGVHEIVNAEYFSDESHELNNCETFISLNRFDILRCCPYYPVGLAFNKEAAKKIDGFDPGKYPSMDYDMWFRMLLNYKGILLPARLAYYRKFENESAKSEVLAGFLNQSYQIRKRVISTYPVPLRYFLDIYSNDRVIADKKNLEKVWGIKIDAALISNLSDMQSGFIKKMISLVVKVLVVVLSGRKSYKLAN